MRKSVYFSAFAIAFLAVVSMPIAAQGQTIVGSCGDSIQVITSFPAPWVSALDDDTIHGIAAVDENLVYVARRNAPSGTSNLDMIYKIDGSGGVIEFYELPDAVCPRGSITGLAIVQGELWFTNDANKDICKLNLEGTPITASKCFDFEADRSAAGCEDSTGLAYCKGHFWNGAFNWDDPWDSCIFKIKVEEVDGELIVKKVKTEHAPGIGPAGLDCDSVSIWHVDISWAWVDPSGTTHQLIGDRIYELNPKAKIICDWDGPGTSDWGNLLGVTFDGTYYWVNNATTFYKMQRVP
jgi:hypothetical protein